MLAGELDAEEDVLKKDERDEGIARVTTSGDDEEDTGGHFVAERTN